MDIVHNAPGIDFLKLKEVLEACADDRELFQAIVNAPFEQRIQTTLMYLGIIVLLLVDENGRSINRIALSNTELGRNTLAVTTVPFHKIKIPVDATENIIAMAIQTGEPRDTTDWRYLFTPAMDAEAARINQASAGISYSAVHPFRARHGGALIFSYFQYRQRIGRAQVAFMEEYSRLVDSVL